MIIIYFRFIMQVVSGVPYNPQPPLGFPTILLLSPEWPIVSLLSPSTVRVLGTNNLEFPAPGIAKYYRLLLVVCLFVYGRYKQNGGLFSVT